MMAPIRHAVNTAMGPSAQMNNVAGMNPIHTMIGQMVLNHIIKNAAAGSRPHQALLGRLMALHQAGMLGKSLSPMPAGAVSSGQP